MRRATGPLIVAAAAVAGLIWSWGTWLDPTIDFGRELYVPWRLSEGDVLFRDIVSFNGPLSHYLLAGWSAFTQADLNRIALRLNQRPRKTLDFRCPADVFDETVALTS